MKLKLRSAVLSPFIVLVCIPFCIRAQQKLVAVQNSVGNTGKEQLAIDIKWYAEQLLYAKGVNIYRRTVPGTTWQKLNTQPVVKQESLSAQQLARDPELSDFREMVEASQGNPPGGFLLLTVVVKSFQSEDFARYLGIFYRDQAVEPGVTYQYKITEIKDVGEQLLAESEPIQAGLYEPITPVREVQFKQEKNSLKFTWTPEEMRYFGVNIYRKTPEETAFSKRNKTPIVVYKQPDREGNPKYPEVMFREDSLAEGQIYTYQFRALDVFWGESIPYTVDIEIKDMSPPEAPYDLKAQVDTFRIRLAWENGQSKDLKGTVVYRGRLSDGPFEKASDILPADKTRYTDTISVPGPYYYYVAAQDHAGNEAASGRTFVEVGDVIPPARPEGLTIESDTGKFTLTWRHNTEGDLKGYLLFRTINKDEARNYVLMNATPIKENFYVQILPKNVKNTFLYKVVAVDTFSNRSEPSEIARAVLPDVTAPDQPFIRSVRQQGNEHIRIEWLPNIDEDLQGYDVYRAYSSDSSNYSRINPKLIKRDTTFYMDEDLPKNGNYFYRLVAADSTGNMSVYSEPVAVNFQSEKSPPVPQNLQVKYDPLHKYNVVTWDVTPPGALLGFVVYRKEEDEYRPVTGMLNTMHYADAAIRKGMTYRYRVNAYTNTGDVTQSGEVEIRVNDEK